MLDKELALDSSLTIPKPVSQMTALELIEAINAGLLIKVNGCDWQQSIETLQVVLGENDSLAGLQMQNINLHRASGAHFFSTFVNGSAPNAKGEIFHFRKPHSFETPDPQEGNVGKVLITLRQHPKTKRWMIQMEEEDYYISPDLPPIKIKRTARSSYDNEVQAVKSRVIDLPMMDFSNPARLGAEHPTRKGESAGIDKKYVIRQWAHQHEIEAMMVDVYDFVWNTHDQMGKATLLEALAHMSHGLRQQIAHQMSTPPLAPDSD